MAVDYDPVKAHEYYENYVKKGRTKGRRRSRTTKGWSQTQKEQWAYAKEQLATEHKEIKTGITEDSKAKRKEISERMKNAVAQLRERLKGMSKEDKVVWRERIQGMIDGLREDARGEKERLTEETQQKRTQENEAYEVRKDQAYDTINAMVQKQKAEAKAVKKLESKRKKTAKR